MKKYITVNVIGCILLTVLILTVTSFGVFADILTKDRTESLRLTAYAINLTVIPSETNLKNYVKKLSQTSDDLRVSIIDKNGMILADSTEMDEYSDHSDRKEISQALNNGSGTDTRKSQTTGVYTTYIAKLLDDGNIIRLAYPVGSIFSFLKTLLLIVSIVLLVVLIFVFFFTKNLSKKLVKPFEDINSLLENGEQIKKAKTFKEIEPLYNNIEYLIEKLNYDLEQITKTEKMRQDFVANASHELKSPLTSIKGFAELMENGMVTDENMQKTYLNRIVRESNRLLLIINDILHLSEAESGQINPATLEQTNLGSLTEEVYKSLESLAKAKNISLNVIGNAKIQSNPKDIWEIIYNLVDNSIRYGNENGFVMLTIEKTETSVILTVEDNGIGIADEHKIRIFERFYRVDKSRSRKGGGTGLGLSIVRNIAGKYGASITAENAATGGTVMKLIFPFRNL